ncbi:MAG: thiamine phosphate synthase [Campylobacterota bacterium]|nr:thiamine phosphate synthase [Campylobacterota bacterium]
MTNKNTKKDALNKSPFFISYFITDPGEFGNTNESLEKNLSKSLSKHQVNMLCFRDKESKDIRSLAKTALNVSKKYNIPKVLINNNLELALELGFDGIHLTSTQFDKIKIAKLNNLYTIISCHSEDEIRLAKKLGSDAVTYSPIFFKENKGSPKGINNLKNMVEKYQDKNFSIIALGAIVSDVQVMQIQTTKASGFASIRYFRNGLFYL